MTQVTASEFAAVVILSTAPDLILAKRISHLLIEEGLASCVHIGQPSLSMFAWDGDVQGEQELPMTIKTSERVLDQAVARIVELHPYDVPEVIVLPVIAGYGPYLEWINATTKS
ncbi:divalent-cation tolerance protein CutA [Orrella marina]|uniref:Divalent-cation tolerance protein CutA n=1 Tax=Orrella marina TaxID=2163011 RepID=A0A2R4XLG9_9BURK|nr:divalent-cation tolerance protein CutA [Orrella marina]AWB34647.1 divalent-cation tolerance protein CutA [Orrella marina]